MKAITVRNNSGRCFIRWVYQDKRYSLTWGMWADKVEKARLEYCAQIIYKDCLVGELDTTLTKYRYWLEGIVSSSNGPVNGNSNSTPKQTYPALIELLEQRLVDYYNVADENLLRHLRNYKKVIDTTVKAKDFITWLKNKGNKSSSQKRYLTILKILRKDLFGDIEIKVAEKPKPKPFTTDEIDRILNSLQTDQYYSHYYGFILTLLNTGLRISEGIGLRWQDVDLQKREIHMYESLGRTRGNTSHRERRTTKNAKYRVIPVNNKLHDLLQDLYKGQSKEQLIFTSPTGKVLDDHLISQRC
ncbi:MAG: site-specific integrase [Nostoc sp.]